MAPQQPSIWSRKFDLLYLTFFLIHIPVMFCADMAPLYPESIKPAFVTSIQNFYITTYKDKFFMDPPAWFKAYTIMELLYHAPLSLWAVPALLQNNPSVPLQLLVWSVQTTVTTLTCLVEVWSWTHINQKEKITLSQLYGPYLALAVGMGIDMFFRLRGRLGIAEARGPTKAAGDIVENPKDK